MARQKLGATEPTRVKGQFKCVVCGTVYPTQARNFKTVQSTLYKGNNNYLCWCNRCVDALYIKYRDSGLSEADAAKKVCSKFDVYWEKDVWDKVSTANKSESSTLIRTYLDRMNLNQHIKKTYDNTVVEEARRQMLLEKQSSIGMNAEESPEVSPELEEFWGKGRDPWCYAELQHTYDRLTNGYTVDTPAKALLVKQACLSVFEIDELQKSGKPFEKQQASLVNTLGSLNLKPSQIKEDERNSGLDDMPFGVAIQKWEQTRPIPEPQSDWVDVDNIRKYNMTWFLGPLCNMVGVDNKYNEMYEEAMSEYRVDRPDYSEDEDVVDE